MAGKILVPQLGFEAIPPVLGVWSLNHWTTREAPTVIFWCSIHLVFVAETPVYPGSSLSCSGQFLRDTWAAVSRAEAVSVVWRINHRRQLSGFVQCCSIIHLEGARMQPPPPLPPPQPCPVTSHHSVTWESEVQPLKNWSTARWFSFHLSVLMFPHFRQNPCIKNVDRRSKPNYLHQRRILFIRTVSDVP